jgi:hypothetical protein
MSFKTVQGDEISLGSALPRQIVVEHIAQTFEGIHRWLRCSLESLRTVFRNTCHIHESSFVI